VTTQDGFEIYRNASVSINAKSFTKIDIW